VPGTLIVLGAALSADRVGKGFMLLPPCFFLRRPVYQLRLKGRLRKRRECRHARSSSVNHVGPLPLEALENRDSRAGIGAV